MTSLVTLVVLAGAAMLPSPSHAATHARSGARTMARIPAGWYRPLYATSGASRIRVAAFAIDREPVTRARYLEFVRAHPEWARGTVRPLFAERGYLADWPSATDAGDTTDLRRPVVNVSWFAAKAYCEAAGKRLPTVDEWERVAAASATRRDASSDPAFRRRLIALYASRSPGTPRPVGTTFTNAFGVSDLHGLVWEWTLDFNSVVIGDDSRASGSGQDARDHHLFCASAAIGAGDPGDFPAFARYAVRAGLSGRSTVGAVGFRCAVWGGDQAVNTPPPLTNRVTRMPMPRLVLSLALACALGGCARSTPREQPATVTSEHGDGWTVYDLTSTWTDQRGTRRSFAALRGTPRVVAMIYTHCTATCPIAITEMKRIEAATPASVGLVLVSLDPDRDTPERLAAYAAERGLSGRRWTLLHGGAGVVRELAAVLDVRYRRLSPTELAHANVITLLDANGVVVLQQHGLGEGDEIVRLAAAMAR
jgi:Uncharacterized conserved protein